MAREIVRKSKSWTSLWFPRLLKAAGINTPFDPQRVWNLWEHNSWGNNLEWLNFEQRRMMGHLPHRLQFREGDEVRCRMQSGKIARFKIVNVDLADGVYDMFFADLEDVGYVE